MHAATGGDEVYILDERSSGKSLGRRSLSLSQETSLGYRQGRAKREEAEDAAESTFECRGRVMNWQAKKASLGGVFCSWKQRELNSGDAEWLVSKEWGDPRRSYPRLFTAPENGYKILTAADESSGCAS